MFIKKKKGGPAALVGPAPINLRSELPFQRHFAQVLNAALMSRLDSSKTQNPLPQLSRDTPITRVDQLKPYHSYWVSRDYAEARGARLMNGESQAGEVILPLPEHYVANTDLMKEGVVARTFFNVGSFAEGDRDKLVRQEGAGPRCGHTGNFFRREELVDNMNNAMTVFQLNDPYWVRAEHPEIKSEYLKLHDDADPLIFSLTGSVLRIGHDIQLHELPYSKYLSPQFHAGDLNKARNGGSTTTGSGDTTSGVNAYTGQKSLNPWVVENAPQGWISLEQLQPFSPGPLKPMAHTVNSAENAELLDSSTSTKKGEAKTASATDLLKFADMGTIVELEQWEVYHSSHLVQPGRLSYDRKVASHMDERRSPAAKGEDAPDSESSIPLDPKKLFC